MDTSSCGFSYQNASQSSAQRKFYQWVLKWISGVHAHADSNSEEVRDFRHLAKLDVATLASFLQAIGFKLLSFEKHDPLIPKKHENNVKTSEQKVLRITIECDVSDMRAVLELGGITCQCPNPDHIKDASFWSVSGTGPIGSTDNIGQKVEETGSNLLPRLSKDVSRVLRDVSYRLFETIACEPDVNRNTDINLNVSRTSNASYEPNGSQNILKKDISVTRSYTQPEIRICANGTDSKCVPAKQSKDINSIAPVSRSSSPLQSNKPALQRQETWDINTETASLDEEPRASPPKLISTPAAIAELSQSLGQISLQSEIEHPKNVTEYIIGAQQNLEKALKMLLTKKPKISIDLSPNQDNDGASVKSAPANISPAGVISPCKPTRSSTITNINPVAKLTHLVPELFPQTKKILENSSQMSRARRSIGPMLSKSAARNNGKLEQENSKPTVRRSSFYIPSSATPNNSLLKPSDGGQRFLASGKFSSSKPDLSSRGLMAIKKSPEQQMDASTKSKTPNTTNRRMSMIKPPTKISKTIPVKIKLVQPAKVNTGMVKKPRVSLSKE